MTLILERTHSARRRALGISTAARQTVTVCTVRAPGSRTIEGDLLCALVNSSWCREKKGGDTTNKYPSHCKQAMICSGVQLWGTKLSCDWKLHPSRAANLVER